MNKLKCASCGWPGLTWAEAKRSYGRIIKAAFTTEAAKTVSPLCSKCATTVVKLEPIRLLRDRDKSFAERIAPAASGQ